MGRKFEDVIPRTVLRSARDFNLYFDESENFFGEFLYLLFFLGTSFMPFFFYIVKETQDSNKSQKKNGKEIDKNIKTNNIK